MPKAAKILHFPRRGPESLPPEVARSWAISYLDSEAENSDVEKCLSSPDTLLAICTVLKERRETSPAIVLRDASRLYRILSKQADGPGLFDEREYFLGELALISGGSARLLGSRDDAEIWFDRAEGWFRHVINPAPLLAIVSYARLTLHYDRHSYARLLELLPSLERSFQSMGMRSDVLRCQFLHSMTLKGLGRVEEAFEKLAGLTAESDIAQESLLYGLVLANLFELLLSKKQYEEAHSIYQEAIPVLRSSKQVLPLIHLRLAMADSLAAQGRFENAIEAYRAAASGYVELEMRTAEAQVRLTIADLMINAGRHREAEWEILAALPTIDEQKMVPEGLAAVALLKESVRRRKTDPNALRELREHLQKQN